VVITGSASTDLEKKTVDGFEVYIPRGTDESIFDKINGVKKFYAFVLEIVNTMVPGLGEGIV
jgi:hypothetical protein